MFNPSSDNNKEQLVFWLKTYHEPYHQNQNPAELWHRTIKAWTNTIMNRTGAPAHCWLLNPQYVCYIPNHISTASLGGQVPLQVLYGVTPDISIIFLYTFYQQVFYATHDQHFASDSDERAGFWVGFAEQCGDSITHMVLYAVTEVPSGPGLPRIPIKGLLMLEGRKIISLTKNPLSIQPQCQMGRSQLHQTLLLSISNQGMMMV